LSLLRLEDLDGVARGERDDRALLVRAAAGHVALALDLALAVHRVDAQHADVPDLLDGLFDLRLVGVGVHEERVPVGLQARVRLLAHDGPDDHVAGGLHSSSPSSSESEPSSSASSALAGALPSRTSSAAAVKTTRSAARSS